MVKYYFNNDTFIIEDFQNAKTFSSFFPAVSGIDGRPLWAFYCNRGQGLSSFGVQSKGTPIITFDSANIAYQRITLNSFRTFIKVNGYFVEPFSSIDNHQTMMKIDKSKLTILENEKDFSIEVVYSTVPHENYSALIRKVKIKNTSNKNLKFEMLDGLPIFYPHGLSNVDYKELGSLMAAYCQVENLNNKMPFIKFKTSTGDCSEVTETKTGNAFVSVDKFNNKLTPIVDSRLVFDNDLSLIKPVGFLNHNDITCLEQQTENKMPTAFSYTKFELAPNEEYEFASLYGKFDTFEIYENKLSNINLNKVNEYILETDKLLEELLSPVEVSSNNNLFDMYAKQSLLDNNLRGGFPILISENNPYYVYGRKHGDMERDYNYFQISDTYYSCGEGNFRDVNQNRRNDIYFYPFVKDYNIKIFFDLIQIDGQNPLSVRPLTFTLSKEILLNDDKLMKIVKGSYLPSELYTYLKDNYPDYEKLFKEIISASTQNVEGDFREGYWIDHWTYNVDLLLNYISVYPDKVKELLFRDDYRYFYSPVVVEPRDEKYCLLKDGRIRQYGAINLKKLKETCEKRNINIKNTDWLKDKNGNIVTTTLAAKIANLITIKFSTLDSKQMGIEMECEKPGWNDAMNGLPGLFASSLGESVEVLRLINFFIEHTNTYQNEMISILSEQYNLLKTVDINIRKLLKDEINDFEYWDNVTTAREKLRYEAKENVRGNLKSIKISSLIRIFKGMRKVLIKGIKKAKSLHNGILPSYLIYEVDNYELTGKTNHLGHKTIKAKSFKLIKIPLFLEASARSFKVGKEIATKQDYYNIKKTDVYDPKLKIYKTCADIDDAPFEIGRVHAFTKGWLERECDFLHMTYKYLLGLLKAGLYKEFYKECKANLVYNMDPYVYGRSPIESSSFIVPTCNPDSKLHGQGFFARLTGANAEFLDMYNTMIFGKNLFLYENGNLKLNLDPKLDKSFFKEDKTFKFKLLNSINVTYINPNNIHAYEKTKVTYVIDGKHYDSIEGELAYKVRNGEIKEIQLIIE